MKTISRFALIALTLVLTNFWSSFAFSAQFSGTVIVSSGEVRVLTAALRADSKTKKFVLYENKKFSYKPAKIGLKLKPGQIVLTGTDGRAKVAYSNGDHIILAPGSSVSMPEPIKSQKGGSSQIKLFYGKIRALVSKRGPRKQMKVKTKTAVAGVRGTDFYLAHYGTVGTELTVLRGAVEFKDEAKKTKPVTVKTGYSAKLEESPKEGKKAKDQEKSEKIEVVEATKKQLIEVQAASNIQLEKKQLEALPEATKKEIKTLEKKALKVVLDDVKDEDPELYEKLSKNKNLKESEINTEVVAKLFKQAPAPKKPAKANLEEIDQIGKDVYDKYFKNK